MAAERPKEFSRGCQPSEYVQTTREAAERRRSIAVHSPPPLRGSKMRWPASLDGSREHITDDRWQEFLAEQNKLLERRSRPSSPATAASAKAP
jgi:hypothetical protein